MKATIADVEQAEQLRATVEALADDGPVRIVVNGDTVELPQPGSALVHAVLAALATGADVDVVTTPRLLTIAEAAPLLWMSEEELTRRIARGWIASKNERLLMSDIIAARKHRASFLDLMQLDQEFGIPADDLGPEYHDPAYRR